LLLCFLSALQATSALDAQSEAAVNAALEHLMHGRTTFVVAHRLASAMKCDLILGAYALPPANDMACGVHCAGQLAVSLLSVRC
jgi:hypothetical protein